MSGVSVSVSGLFYDNGSKVGGDKNFNQISFDEEIMTLRGSNSKAKPPKRYILREAIKKKEFQLGKVPKRWEGVNLKT